MKKPRFVMGTAALALVVCALLVLSILPGAGNKALATDTGVNVSALKDGTLGASMLWQKYREMLDADKAVTEVTLYRIGDAAPETTEGWKIYQELTDYDERFDITKLVKEKDGSSVLQAIANDMYEAICQGKVKKDGSAFKGEDHSINSDGDNYTVYDKLKPGVYIVGLKGGLSRTRTNPDGTGKYTESTLSLIPYFLTIPSVVDGKVTYAPSIEMKAEYELCTPTPTPTPPRSNPPRSNPPTSAPPTSAPPQSAPPLSEPPRSAPPVTEVFVQKEWEDFDNAHGLRPASISVQLFGNDEPVASATLTGPTWAYRFTRLPVVDPDGDSIIYTVQETPVNGYETYITGTIILNRLIPREPNEYRIIGGTKIWDDAGEEGRPSYVVAYLYRDGELAAQRTVTAASNWTYSFGEWPVDDGYGHIYEYTIREGGVAGYFSRTVGDDLINSPIPDDADEKKTEEELEGLLDLFDYNTPVFELMKTGDETPLYPYVFAGIGAMAIVLLLVFGKKRQKKAGAGQQ